jgi:hypothetical protein
VSSKKPLFVPCDPQIWKGRYGRIPGYEPVLHVRLSDGQWQPAAAWVASDEIGTCPMADHCAAAGLAAAVNAGKQLLGGYPGGSFVINEFGQILVPGSSGDGRVALVGEWNGDLEFDDPLHGGTFCLNCTEQLKPGDRWQRPYIGIPYNLSQRNELYCWVTNAQGGGKRLPPVQDGELINALRTVRSAGPVRFIVICGGLVVTKAPSPNDWTTWEPRYVGRLDYNRWFVKES